ncbi:MAG: four-carbon acid sugar kinase family protein [Spirochaetaceae bacterium]|nr:four-carbon acid sugar kinase family protein [Spirochaetaceae bacterium]
MADLHRIFSKILVLDDDPTGSQTVYDMPVYTHFDLDDLLSAHRDESRTVYVLTNSRSLHKKETEELHRHLIQNWMSVDSIADDPGGETLVISRGDSTLREHYPLETDTVKDTLASGIGATILVPAFPEGGRFTMDDIHYVREDHLLVPAAETEFSRDSSFGYTSSNLRHYVEEKTGGAVRAADVVSIGLDSLQAGDIDGIARKLADAPKKGAVVVNAVDYNDLKVFTVAFARTAGSGQRFVFRSAASLVKVFAGLDDKALLKHNDMFAGTSAVGGPGILAAGSYVGKTTRLLASLVNQGILVEVNLNIRTALHADAFPAEVRRAGLEAEEHMKEGRSVCLYTTNAGRREFLSADESDEDLSDL